MLFKRTYCKQLCLRLSHALCLRINQRVRTVSLSLSLCVCAIVLMSAFFALLSLMRRVMRAASAS